MKKVVINVCYGGFGLSHEAHLLYAQLKGRELEWWWDDITRDIFERYHSGKELTPSSAMLTHYNWKGLDKEGEGYFYAQEIPRDDPDLVAVVERLGPKANTRFSKLVVVEIPDDVAWQVEEYDGLEHVAETHRTWG